MTYQSNELSWIIFGNILLQFLFLHDGKSALLLYNTSANKQHICSSAELPIARYKALISCPAFFSVRSNLETCPIYFTKKAAPYQTSFSSWTLSYIDWLFCYFILQCSVFTHIWKHQWETRKSGQKFGMEHCSLRKYYWCKVCN